ncbi:glucan biosynthesis protein D [Sinirhodobacter populi]|uniref:Glucan biosynthesis protein D n=2 Tax=Paenirhodobacter populi TaxID=2306993 RepID=A0A443KC32_9RHOB|nr:glucan biosynthesis protein [Sinirhodobacter populi]RWR07967.1 glucan biosynthesis protein D [Sinirhodobacter populi]RWR30320.1 glucan biosynthesis protein D [Sinirhodobacter populi]
MLSRRALLQGATALAGTSMFLPRRVQAEPVPFSFEALTARAEALAGQAYVPPYQPMPDVVQQIDYAQHGKLKFRPEKALFAGQPGADLPAGYPLEFFHLGQYFTKRVQMYTVVDGQATEVPYSTDFFEMPEDSPARQLPPDAGFAGFRLQEWNTEADWPRQDWVAFLGASYFRAIGAAGQYGLSARGIVLDAAVPDRTEEFPDFTEFYIEEMSDPNAPVTVCALLDGPSISGAYRFRMTRGLDRSRGVQMEIEAKLWLRKDVERLGLTPLTSMFWFGEYGRQRLTDWRPEVHDSDGLAMWTGAGERIWRPLNNPVSTQISAFVDENPRGFGLLQRDRNFDHFLDGVMYDRRPCLWVEPIVPFGRGTVQLLEIPTDDEIHDNIGAFWVPEEPARAGSSYTLNYRLYWQNTEPFVAENIAQTVASRIGRGGTPGLQRPENVYHFGVEFDRPAVMQRIPYGVFPEVVVTTTTGTISRVFSEPVPNGNVWRANFDIEMQPDESADLRMYMALDGVPLTETWIYQFTPRLAMDL